MAFFLFLQCLMDIIFNDTVSQSCFLNDENPFWRYFSVKFFATYSEAFCDKNITALYFYDLNLIVFLAFRDSAFPDSIEKHFIINNFGDTLGSLFTTNNPSTHHTDANDVVFRKSHRAYLHKRVRLFHLNRHDRHHY